MQSFKFSLKKNITLCVQHGHASVPSGGGAGAWDGTLIFACYIGSLPTLLFNPKEYQRFLAYPKKYSHCRNTQKIPRLYISTNDVYKNKQLDCWIYIIS